MAGIRRAGSGLRIGRIGGQFNEVQYNPTPFLDMLLAGFFSVDASGGPIRCELSYPAQTTGPDLHVFTPQLVPFCRLLFSNNGRISDFSVDTSAASKRHHSLLLLLRVAAIVIFSLQDDLLARRLKTIV